MGFEPTTASLEGYEHSAQGDESTDTCSAAPGSANQSANHSAQELAEIVKAWPTLPDAVKAGILAMVKASGTAR